jgi:MFS family permease
MGIFWTCWIANILKSGLNLQQSCIAAAVWFLGIGAFELPTGLIADKFGRKISTILGTLGMGAGFFIMGMKDSPLFFYIALGLAGVGSTMISGALDAWLFNLAKDIKGDSLKSESFWTGVQLGGRVGIIVGGFYGAWMTSINPGYVWLSAAVVAASAVVLLVSSSKGSADLEVHSPSIAKSSLSAELAKPAVYLILASTILWGIESGTRNIIYQPFILEMKDFNYFYLAYFQASLSVIRIVGLLVYKHAFSKLNLGAAFGTLSLVAFGISELYASVAESYWSFMLVYGVGVFCLSWFFPIKAAVINDNIEEKNRATVLSIDGMMDSLSQAVTCLVLSGLLVGDLQPFWKVGGVALLVCGAVFYIGAKTRPR